MYLLEQQRRGIALRIAPLQAAVAYFQLGLLKQPAYSGIGSAASSGCGLRFAGAVKQYACNVNAPVGMALRLHAGRNNSQTGKARAQQAAHRYARFNPRNA